MEINISETQKKQNNTRGNHRDDSQNCFVIFPPGTCNKYTYITFSVHNTLLE